MSEVETVPVFGANETGYDPQLDDIRIGTQLRRVWDLMSDGEWRTLGEIAEEADGPEASVSADLRTLRLARFGSHTVLKRRRGNPERGLWEYKVIR